MGKLRPAIDPAKLTSDEIPLPAPTTPPVTVADLDVDARLARIEAALGIALVVAEPVEVRDADQDAAARAAALVGGLRIVTIPTPPVPPPGQPSPRPGLDVSVTDDSGCAVLLTLTPGLVFDPGPVADAIEATAAAGGSPGLTIERLTTTEGNLR